MIQGLFNITVVIAFILIVGWIKHIERYLKK